MPNLSKLLSFVLFVGLLFNFFFVFVDTTYMYPLKHTHTHTYTHTNQRNLHRTILISNKKNCHKVQVHYVLLKSQTLNLTRVVAPMLQTHHNCRLSYKHKHKHKSNFIIFYVKKYFRKNKTKKHCILI